MSTAAISGLEEIQFGSSRCYKESEDFIFVLAVLRSIP